MISIQTRGDSRITDTTFIPPKRWTYKTVSSHDTTSTPTNCSTSGFAACSTSYVLYTVNITTKRTDAEIKKMLKRMMDRWCIDSWHQYIPYYSTPKLQPINLRGVRLDGRGWANL